MRKKLLILTVLLVVAVLSLSACSAPGQGQPTQSAEPVSIPTLPIVEPTHLVAPIPSEAPVNQDDLVEMQTALQPDGPLAVQNILALNTAAFGNILQLEIANTGSQDLSVIIPCGLVFGPAGGSQEQRLMVIQSTEFILPASETQTHSPYLAGIDSRKPIPSPGAGYQVSQMMDGNLLSLAQCICSRELVAENDDFNNLAVQFAVWMVAEGAGFNDLLARPADGGALSQLMGVDNTETLRALTDTLAVPATNVVRSCNIAIP